MTTSREFQCAPAVMMIRPVSFLANPQTKGSNAFQRDDVAIAADEQQARALAEFDALAAALQAAGVETFVFEDTPEPHTPDSIFPNNWVSFHPDGRAVLYPMMAENRRLERREDLLDELQQAGFRVGEVLDLSGHEAEARYLEGTGSMVLDRVHRIAYACLSPRTDTDVLDDFAARLGYTVEAFEAVGPDGRAIYHTNVLMNVGDGFAVIGPEAIPHPEARERVLTRLTATGHDVVALDFGQLLAFAGNMLALRDARGGQVLAMSRRAAESLRPDQRAVLEQHARIVDVPIPTIEDSAGGSVRCMLAEVFLPR